MTQEKKHSELKVITQDQAYALLEACKMAIKSGIMCCMDDFSKETGWHKPDCVYFEIKQAIKAAEEG